MFLAHPFLHHGQNRRSLSYFVVSSNSRNNHPSITAVLKHKSFTSQVLPAVYETAPSQQALALAAQRREIPLDDEAELLRTVSFLHGCQPSGT